MGQCSTMPDHHGGGGTNNAASASNKYESTPPPPYYHQHDPSSQQHYQHRHHQQPRQQRDDYADHRRATETTVRNPTNEQMYMEEDPGPSSGEDSKTPLMTKGDASRNGTANMTSFLHVVRQSVNALDPFLNNDGKNNAGMMQPPQNASSYTMRNNGRVHPHSQMVAEQQPEAIHQQRHPPAPPLPPNSVRMRCYRLNLESNMYLATNDSSSKHYHHNSNSHQINPCGSDDSSVGSTRKIVLSTAKIFRGITVSRDGTVSSRKMRSSSNHPSSGKGKVGEKSRQAAKIDKAKDLVEQLARGGKGSEGKDDDPTNMVSLFIMGEYDDIKHLVRDGAKKLKEAEDLPDESLLAINRPRANSERQHTVTVGPFCIQELSSPSARTNSKHSYHQHHHSMRSSSRSSRLNNSVPPKLKSHPRDVPSRYHSSTPTSTTQSATTTPTSATNNRQQQQHHSSRSTKFPNVPHQCSEFNIFGGGDSDWSEALNFSKGFHNIWNCGASGNEPMREPYNHNNTNAPGGEGGTTRECSGRVRSYSNEEFRAMKQQQQSRYDNAVVVMEGREEMVIDHPHGCFRGNTTPKISRYKGTTNDGNHPMHGANTTRESPSSHHQTNSSSRTGAPSGNRSVNDVILV